MGSKGSQTVRQINEPNPQMLAAYLDVVKRAQGAADRPFTPYSGDLTAGFSPLQTQTFGNVQDFISNPSDPIYTKIQDYYSPYQEKVVDATRANLAENDAIQREALRGNAISAGAWGGDRAGVAEAELIRKQNLASGQTIAGLEQQGYQQATAAALADQQRLQQEALSKAQLGLGAGAVQQGQEQKELDTTYQQWLNQQAYPFQTTQFLSGVVGQQGPAAGGSASTTQPGPSMLGQVGGLGLTGLGLYNAGAFSGIGSALGKGASGLGAGIGALALSDEREKEDIEKVGHLDDGLPIYKYRYKGDPTFHIGLLAQEVEKEKPNAVAEDEGGTKYVDYDKATMAAGGAVMPYQKAMGFVPTGNNPMPIGKGLMPNAPTPTKQQTMVESLNAMIPALQAIKTKANGGAVKGFAAGSVPDFTSYQSLFDAPDAGILAPRLPYSPNLDERLLDSPNKDIMSRNPGMFGVPAAGVLEQPATETMLPPNAVPVQHPLAPPMNIQPPLPMEETPSPPPSTAMPMNPEAPNNDAWLGLAAAGLGAMASRSPFAGVALGEGGLQGLQTFQQLKTARLQERDRQIRQQQVEQQAKRLEQMALQEQRNYELGLRREDERQRANTIKEEAEQWAVIGPTEDGTGILQQNKKDGTVRVAPLNGVKLKPKEDTFTKLQQKEDQGIVSTYRKGADASRDLLAQVNQMRELRKGFDWSGIPFVTPLAGKVDQLAGSGNAQAIESLATDMRLGFTSKTKGAISDKEMAMFTGATPGTNMTNQTADKVMLGYEALAKRSIERSKFFETWLAKNKNLTGAQDAWDRYINENPILSGDLSKGDAKINEQNIGNWQKYVNQDASATQPTAQNQNLKPMTDAIRAKAQQLIQQGATPQAVAEELRKKGIDPSGLQ